MPYTKQLIRFHPNSEVVTIARIQSSVDYSLRTKTETKMNTRALLTWSPAAQDRSPGTSGSSHNRRAVAGPAVPDSSVSYIIQTSVIGSKKTSARLLVGPGRPEHRLRTCAHHHSIKPLCEQNKGWHWNGSSRTWCHLAIGLWGVSYESNHRRHQLAQYSVMRLTTE